MQGPNHGVRPSQAPPPREVWCEEHRRPVAPDGRCSLCVKGDDPARSERRVVLVMVAIAMLGGIGPAAYYFFWARHEEDRKAAVSAGRSTEGATQSKPGPVAQREQWVDEETPPMDVVEDPKEKARREQQQRREAKARRRSMRQRGRRPGGRAQRAGPTAFPEERPRATGRVPITMYMAHW